MITQYPLSTDVEWSHPADYLISGASPALFSYLCVGEVEAIKMWVFSNNSERCSKTVFRQVAGEP